MKTQYAKYKKKLTIYKAKISKSKQNQDRVKQRLPQVLQSTLQDALNIYLGKPKINGFDKYNADDEVFITKIGSDKFSISVDIQIKAEEAQRLDQQNKLRYLKPKITLEYTSGNLYISKVEVHYKKRTYAVNIENLSNYNPDFKLKSNVRDTFIIWSDAKIKDKTLLTYMNKATISKKVNIKEHKRVKKNPTKVYRTNETLETKDGLVWQDNKEAKITKFNWSDAEKYCQDLNLANKRDWRLPSYKELYSLVDYTKHYPAIIDGFKNVYGSSYWSSSINVSNSKMWEVSFYSGSTYYYKKSEKIFHVRCVRDKN